MHITTTAKDIIEKIEEAMVRQAWYNIPVGLSSILSRTKRHHSEMMSFCS